MSTDQTDPWMMEACQLIALARGCDVETVMRTIVRDASVFKEVAWALYNQRIEGLKMAAAECDRIDQDPDKYPMITYRGSMGDLDDYRSAISLAEQCKWAIEKLIEKEKKR